MADSMDGIKPKSGPNRNQKVRVIAKIRGFRDLETVSKPWISVDKRDGASSHSLTFRDQSPATRKEIYEVDCCYEQDERSDLIFEREVKPLVNEVFDGRNATIFACGARGSGKTFLIQGKDAEPGLAVLTIAEMLELAANSFKSISVSFFEVDHDHVKDLLNQKQQVLVLKNTQGKTQLKGLSQVLVTSKSEFQKLCGGVFNSSKPIQKAIAELPKRGHKGLIVYVSSYGGEKLADVTVTKLNFVDLAGYQDSRKKGVDGHNLAESTKIINKSIHSIHDVVYSLKTTDIHVPYRETKITHMLQDSLGGNGRILLVTCLNPSFCQDSIYMVSLASRSCQGTTRAIIDSTKKAKSSGRSLLPSYQKSRSGVSASVKKQTVSRVHVSGNKANFTTSALKARKLFDKSSNSKSLKEQLTSNIAKETPSLEEQLTSNVAKETASLEAESSSLLAQEDSNLVSKEASPLAVSSICETTTVDKEASPPAVSCTCETILDETEDNHNKIASCIGEFSVSDEDRNINKENNNSIINERGSPPISAQLQELPNSLKLLCSSTSCLEMTPKNDVLHNQALTDIVEPITPSTNTRVDRDITNFCSPWETFNTRSAGAKNSRVQEYLRVLNTADKEELKKLKGIGEKRATYILELQEESPEPFKNVDDLKEIGLSAKQIKGLISKEVGGLFH